MATAGYVFFAHSFVSYLVVAIVDGSALSASTTANVALLRRVGGDDATTFRARTVAVVNLNMSLGIATCGVAIELNTVNAYRALFLGNALSCLIGVAVLSLLPKYEPLPGAHEESPLAALRDRPFLGYTALSGAMYRQYFVLGLLLPVWVVFHTNGAWFTSTRQEASGSSQGFAMVILIRMGDAGDANQAPGPRRWRPAQPGRCGGRCVLRA